jgi:DNA-binding XRE family transcriptional regulator
MKKKFVKTLDTKNYFIYAKHSEEKLRNYQRGRMVLRKNLIAERRLKDFTQVQTARQIGITSRQYQALEAATSDGSLKVWDKLSKLFGKPIDYLLEQAERQKGPGGNRVQGPASQA